MKKQFDPVGTWIFYGLSDLYFGSKNLSNHVYRYGTFSYIMASEKHLKAVLINNKKDAFELLDTIEEKRKTVDKLVRSYSHNFKDMIQEVSLLYQKEMNKIFVPENYDGFDTEKLIQAMYDGYLETRYPSVRSTAKNFPVGTQEGVYHDPLGSSFFTDFNETICRNCLIYLKEKGINVAIITADFKERFSDNIGFKNFETQYLNRIT